MFVPPPASNAKRLCVCSAGPPESNAPASNTKRLCACSAGAICAPESNAFGIALSHVCLAQSDPPADRDGLSNCHCVEHCHRRELAVEELVAFRKRFSEPDCRWRR